MSTVTSSEILPPTKTSDGALARAIELANKRYLYISTMEKASLFLRENWDRRTIAEIHSRVSNSEYTTGNGHASGSSSSDPEGYLAEMDRRISHYSNDSDSESKDPERFVLQRHPQSHSSPRIAQFRF